MLFISKFPIFGQLFTETEPTNPTRPQHQSQQTVQMSAANLKLQSFPAEIHQGKNLSAKPLNPPSKIRHEHLPIGFVAKVYNLDCILSSLFFFLLQQWLLLFFSDAKKYRSSEAWY